MSTMKTLLALLETEPAHGYTLKQRCDTVLGRSIGFSQIYTALASSEKRGLVEVERVEIDAGPERKRYRITADGVELVEEWLLTPEPPGAYAAGPLLTKVAVALLSGRDPHRVLASQRGVHLERMRSLTTARRTSVGAELLAVTFELAHLDADLRWIEDAGARIERAAL